MTQPHTEIEKITDYANRLARAAYRAGRSAAKEEIRKAIFE